MRRLTPIVILLLLSMPLIGLMIGIKPQAQENRAQLTWPAASLSALADGSYFSALGEVLTQRLPLRKQAVDFKRWLWLDLLGERRFDRVVIGAENTLFLRPSLNAWCGWSQPWTVARKANAQLPALLQDKPFLWVSVPDKFFVHGDLLPSHFQDWRACADQRRRHFATAMKKTLGTHFIDLAPVLRQRAARSKNLLYFAEDTHWKPSVSLVLPRAVLARWLPGAWDRDHARAGEEEWIASDLAQQLGLNHLHAVRRWHSERPGVSAPVMQTTERVKRMGIRRIRHTARQDVPMIPGITLIIHDSFLLPVTAALAPYFEEVILVQWEDLDAPRFQRLLAEADRVLLQSVDRVASQRQQLGIPRLFAPEPPVRN